LLRSEKKDFEFFVFVSSSSFSLFSFLFESFVDGARGSVDLRSLAREFKKIKQL